ncbi:MAG: large conductance mechanosensitive channel protein MscL [Erysipelotrichaceae bacterium]|nr:large conductance mechanosensitive channel protein MscL [Erysipelotrichaceae bacterium]
MKKFFGEFKKFITRGNIVDMSVGVIVGGAFTGIVNALSNNILKPVINFFLALILGKDSLSGIFTYLKKVETTQTVDGVTTTVVDLEQSIYIDWGAFINAIINFLIIAFVLFSIVKALNKLSESQKRLQDRKNIIAYKQDKGIKLSKKDLAFLKDLEEKEQQAKEAALKAEEEARIKAEEEAKKLTKSEALLVEIRDLLAKK